MKKHLRLRLFSLLLTVLLLSAPLFVGAARYQTLRPGAQGPRVEIMQSALARAGFDIKADGKYGLKTQEVVKAFQRQKSLETDGLAGHQTLSALFSLVPELIAAFDSASGQAAAPAVSVQPFQQTQPVSSPPVANAGSQTATVVTSNRGALNVRSNAGWGLNVIGKVDHGTQVQVLEASGAWSKIAFSGQTGWVVSTYLRKEASAVQPPSNPAPVQQPVTQAPEETKAVLSQAQVFTPNGKSLNLRDKAGYSGKTQLGIPHLAKVDILAKMGQWTQVNYQGRTGYVVDSFLRHGSSQSQPQQPDIPSTPAEQSPAVPSQPQTPVGQAVVTTSRGRYLNFRSAPATGQNIIGQILSGTRLNVLSKSDDWCQVQFDGKTGYVMTSFLQFDQPAPAAPSNPAPDPAPDQPVQPSGSEQPVFARTLRFAMSGEDVLALQTRLKELKYNTPVSGTYDQQTQDAVASFQAKNALTPDGVFGPQSASMLQSSAARSADSAPLSYTTLRIDDRNDAVASMQKALLELGYQLSVNSRYDVPTHQAVVGFQQRNGLPITGVANAVTQAAIFSSNAKGFDTPVEQLAAGEGKGEGPSSGQVQLLHWFNDVKKNASAGQKVTVHHPVSGISFTIRFYSMGKHADSEPATWRDTQLMNRAFGTPSWNINTVYVKLPDGRWTLASMHNRPHLTGAVSDNGFGGHLCVHFLRDMDEVNRNDPDYGASNQRSIRKAWQNMTGEVVP